MKKPFHVTDRKDETTVDSHQLSTPHLDCYQLSLSDINLSIENAIIKM